MSLGGDIPMSSRTKRHRAQDGEISLALSGAEKRKRGAELRGASPDCVATSMGAVAAPAAHDAGECLGRALYRCEKCSAEFQQDVLFNPVYSLLRVKCPACNRLQWARINISDAQNQSFCHPIQRTLDRLARERAASRAAAADESGDEAAAGSAAPEREAEAAAAEQDSAREAKLLVLVRHALLCDGKHKSQRLSDICETTKVMLVHARSCASTKCEHAWCKTFQKLMHHEVSCKGDEKCQLCRPKHLPERLAELSAMNAVQRMRLRHLDAEKLENVKEKSAAAHPGSIGGLEPVLRVCSPCSSADTDGEESVGLQCDLFRETWREEDTEAIGLDLSLEVQG